MDWIAGLTISKDPDSVLDWSFDFSDYLLSGEVIDSFDLSVSSGLNLHDGLLEFNGEVRPAPFISNQNAIAFWLSGGVPGVEYDVRCRITTDSNRIDDRTFIVSVNNL